ncbi:uncharacterized protein LOC127835042 isoform X2 [Dreissena polymorpha]|uniref:Uncharacterized protein n=1 Tax=Dreissena polymorpha TaxID=45954 RepID=A0A9D4G7F5_DREPO|nr:uncharacterized protein LOC127835042 isoform X2 [Dreissena polymorpha]KAH3810133.1 hypothetical protein DPMN_138519 [Dreissena polymorpha]
MATVNQELMQLVARTRAFLKSHIAWVAVVIFGVGLLVCIIVPVVLTGLSKTHGDTPKFTATCVLVDYTMWRPIQTRCKVSVPAEIKASIDVSQTLFSLNSGDVLPVNCSYQVTDGVITCQGPHVTCQIRGTLSIAFFDNAGNAVLDKILFNLGSLIPPLVTSVVQVFEPVGKNFTSNFNFTCAVTSSCDTYTMALYVDGNLHLTEEDALLCINTSMTEGGYNKSCVFKVDEDVIRQQRSMDISCALLQNNFLAKQEKFLLPMCSKRSSDCNCSAKTTSCDEICTKVGTCLKHDDISRYQNITTEDVVLKPICPVLCTPKWCRDKFNDDKTETLIPAILGAMCTNS